MGIKKDSAVTQKVTPIKGVVKQTRYHEGTESLEHLVVYKGDDGEDHERWFLASEVTEDAPATAGEQA